MVILAIIEFLMLVAACITIGILLKRLLAAEDGQNATTDEILTVLEELEISLAADGETVETVAGLDVVSNDHHVRRVVTTISNARRSLAYAIDRIKSIRSVEEQ